MEILVRRKSKNKDWGLAGIFADEGITGTSAKKRAEFLKLMPLCKKGKVNIVLTKSVSRFSRNTLDAIGYICKLKAKGIPIIFEKGGINTMEMASEMPLCFLSGLAQAESESISRNVTWGKRQSFKSGKVPFQYSRLLGYEKGEDDQPKILPEEAEIAAEIKALQEQLDEHQEQTMLAQNTQARIHELLYTMEYIDLSIKEYRDDVVKGIITKVVILSSDRISVTFKGNMEMEQELTGE